MDADSGRMSLRPSPPTVSDRRGAVIVFLLGVGLAWSAGNVGPVVTELGREFGLSLTSVGILSGTLFYAAMVLGIMVAPRVAERIGLINGMVVACALGALGNLVFALGSGFAMLAIGRVVAGAALGFGGVLGPVFARATGGVKRVGIFGAAFQLGIAGGLGVGSLLADSGVDWRVGFVVSALAAASAIPVLWTEKVAVDLQSGPKGFLRAALRSPKVMRLGLLFVAMFAVPLTMGAWFVHYTTEDGGLAAALAGGLAFLLFGVSALMREVGGKLAARGVSRPLLAGVMPWLAAVGLVLIALDRSAGVVALAAILMGAGFALPYAVMMTEAQRLYPAEPAEPTALLSMAGTGAAIVVIPVLGSVLNAGNGKAGFLVLAAFVVIAGIANLRPVSGAVAEP